MPALSPTMTEGNIATWKVKEGDSFVAGDVLLEIETDKAQMDVEAQDDGVLAKILQGDGSKAVQVGTRIAVTAEPGDDLSTLEIPADNSKPSQPEASKEASKSESAPAPKKDTPASSSKPASSGASKSPAGKAQKQTYPLYPSVQHLLKQNGLPKEEADKIPATGPNGRLLKGDVLAYLGKINESAGSEVAARLKQLSHLDLSNIKPMAQKPKPAPEKAAAIPEEVLEELDIEVALPISLKAVTEVQQRVQKSIGVFLPLSTFIARAAELANEDLPRSQVAKPSADELFNAVLGLDKVGGKYSRGDFVPQVTALPPTTLSPRIPARKPDVLDFLAGKKAAAPKAPVGGAAQVVGPLNVFSVSVPKGDERRGRVFLERVKSVLEAEPGRLVV
ncbi:pyridoxine biosynthesis protein [Didymosphaeria variabile]|uniref:Pyridoxine biosynthesis protein n=1 Tax=Didymosphaeria variabile TaxID=1932322 RepID=A0A9W9CEH3_9PLEO|nr:pyridoxine biosynthesis protein [Didymosphaeria variabile]KAJ4358746.1 pyridoxine biosynthesis protein [Didymosphaeria variabile]